MMFSPTTFAIGANQIARVELFGQIRWVHLAVTADQTHVEVGNKVIFALGCITTGQQHTERLERKAARMRSVRIWQCRPSWLRMRCEDRLV